MAERTELVFHVMHWEAKAIATKDFLKEAEFIKGLDIANAVDEAPP